MIHPLVQKGSSPADVIAAGIIGTLTMTACSRLLSLMEKEDFTEHHLLDFVFRHWGLKDSRMRSVVSVAAHYGVGIAWTAVYAALLKKRRASYGRGSSLAIGGVTGLAAVAAWKLMLGSASQEPPTNEEKFLWQLIPVHMVFGLVSISYIQHSRKR